MSEERKPLVFSVDSAEIIEDNPDSRFITCRIHAFSSGKNYHKLYCSEETLKRTASTIYNMPIVYNLINSGRDFGSHVEVDKSLICGFAIPDTGSFEKGVDEFGNEILKFYVDAKIWKIYVPAVSEILEKRDGKVGISVEMWLYESHIREDNGIEEMDDFCYFGICLLGKAIQSAIQNAELQVLSFSQINEKYHEDYLKEFSKYSSIDFSISQEIKNNSNKGLDLYKQYGTGGNSVALSIARHFSKNDKASPEKIKSTHKYLSYHQNDIRKKSPPNGSYISWMLYGGNEGLEWSKEMVKQMKEIEDKPMSYFDNGEVITFPYSKIEDVPENMKKLDGIALTLDQINQISKVADAIGVDEKKNGYAIAKSQFKKDHHIDGGHWIKNKSVKKEELSVKDENDKELEPKEETMAEEKLPESETQPEEEKMAVETEEMAVEEKPETSEEEKKEDEEKETLAEEVKEEEPKEEKMSLDANLDMAALMAMLADETEDYKALVAKHEAGEEMDYAMLCSKMYGKMKAMQAESDAAKEDKDVYMAKNADLQEYKDKIEKQQFDYAVEKTIQEVSDVFTKEEIENAREEVRSFSIENLPAWQSSIKSAAYERIKDAPKKKESFTRMATVHSWLNRDDKPEDVTKEYAKKGWL